MSNKYQTTYALPGQPLGVDSEYQAGPGTYLNQTLRLNKDGNSEQKVITSALAGRVFILESQQKQGGGDNLPIIAILKPISLIGDGQQRGGEEQEQIRAALLTSGPDNGELAGVGDTVLARITRIGIKQANVSILIVENSNSFTNNNIDNTGDDYSGIIRSQDIRQFDRDEPNLVPISFRPGDLIRAQVLSLGDGNNYYLSTAQDNLGVIFAKCSQDDEYHKGASGEIMYPIDWMHMKCPKTGHIETRKCAKPV